jgi:excisionase family DNA binding protein
MTEPLVLTVEEAARLLRIGRGSAYEAVRAGDIPSVRIGRRVLVPREALLSLLNANAPAANGRAGEEAEVTGHVPA